MAIKPFNWRCPHCDHDVTITEDVFSGDVHRLWRPNAEGQIALLSRFLICPNKECRKPTLNVALRRYESLPNGDDRYVGDPILDMRLVPFGKARPFPDFVPQPIREDYEEACLIRDLSAKSAATLSRRALQGILRDFYKVKPGRLVDEINALENTMEPELFDAIHGVRKVGNIGAHMEADINVIVDVDPNEAQLLIELVETMIEETYVRREQRRNRLQKVAALADTKEQARRALPASAAQGVLPSPNAAENA
jgi:hypothetical protein